MHYSEKEQIMCASAFCSYEYITIYQPREIGATKEMTHECGI